MFRHVIFEGNLENSVFFQFILHPTTVATSSGDWYLLRAEGMLLFRRIPALCLCRVCLFAQVSDRVQSPLQACGKCLFFFQGTSCLLEGTSTGLSALSAASNRPELACKNVVVQVFTHICDTVRRSDAFHGSRRHDSSGLSCKYESLIENQLMRDKKTTAYEQLTGNPNLAKQLISVRCD